GPPSAAAFLPSLAKASEKIGVPALSNPPPAASSIRDGPNARVGGVSKGAVVKKFCTIASLFVFSAAALFAQDLTGTWQGTLTLPNGKELRTVVKVSKEGAAMRGLMYSIDQGAGAIPINPVTLQGAAVKMAMPGIGGEYEGKLEADGKTITGTFKQGPNP